MRRFEEKREQWRRETLARIDSRQSAASVLARPEIIVPVIASESAVDEARRWRREELKRSAARSARREAALREIYDGLRALVLAGMLTPNQAMRQFQREALILRSK